MLLACTAGGDHEGEPIGWIHEAADRRLRRVTTGLVPARPSLGRCRAAEARLRRVRAELVPALLSLGRCLVADPLHVVAARV
jgi:hypothetical protein